MLTVAIPLFLAVPGDAGRMRLPVLFPVIRMLLPPLAGALAAGFGVFGIGGQPAAVKLRLTLPLAFSPAANVLLRLVSGWLKCLLAKPATPLKHEGVVAFHPTVM